MKKTTNLVILFALSLLCMPLAVRAQDIALAAAEALPAVEAASLAAQYAAEPEAERSPEWWSRLEAEINLPPAASSRRITEAALQNVIFFATMHGDKLDLNPSVAALVEVYRHDRDDARRLMAVAALHAIGSRQAIAGLRSSLRPESNARVRHVTLSALKTAHAH